MKNQILALCALLIAGCAHAAAPVSPAPPAGPALAVVPAPAPKPKTAPAPKPPPPPLAPVTLTDFKLVGNLSGDLADFTLTASAHVEDVRGGSLDLLSGPVALTAMDAQAIPHSRLGRLIRIQTAFPWITKYDRI